MATSQTGAGEKREELTDIKRKLAWRMGFAGLMIVALLGGLALFDHYSGRVEPEAPAPQFTEPVPVPKKSATQPVTPAGPETAKAEPEASSAPVDKAAPALEPPPRPQVAAQPTLPRGSAAPVKPAAPAKLGEAKPAESKPAAPMRAELPPAATSQAQPTPPRLFSGYALQAGVFADPRRAEELHAKLTLEGIPSTIEARVQVGPFKSKAEAEAAREKLKTLGIETVLLPPKGPRR